MFNEPPDEALRKMSEQTAVSIPKLCMPIRQVAMLRLSRPGAKAVQVCVLLRFVLRALAPMLLVCKCARLAYHFGVCRGVV